MSEKVPIPPSIYFGGCAFGGAFYVGVHKAMVERWGADFYKKTIISGGSIGAGHAIQCALGRSADEMAEFYEVVANAAHKHGVFMGSQLYEQYLTEMLRCYNSKAHQIVKGRFWTCLTYFPFKFRWEKEWKNDNELLSHLLSTCHIPLYSHIVDIDDDQTMVLDGAYGISGEHFLELDGNETLFVGIDNAAEVTTELTFSEMVSKIVVKMIRIIHNMILSIVFSTSW
jgi:predicted acylesterase/phospholipase RssA